MKLIVGTKLMNAGKPTAKLEAGSWLLLSLIIAAFPFAHCLVSGV